MNHSGPYRLCPKCRTRRSVSESVCQRVVDDLLCGWDLLEIEIQDDAFATEAPPQVSSVVGRETHRCPNGHAVETGDLICPECGADIFEPPISAACAAAETPENILQDQNLPELVAGWETILPVPATDDVRQRYHVRRLHDGCEGLLTIYHAGSQPDSQVYEALQNRVPREHIVELIQYGELDGHSYDITERIENGSLANLRVDPTDFDTVRQIVEELSTALAAFMEVGLRHRTLHPQKILVRSMAPLDLVITGFESGRLSDADLETESLLDVSRYTAPEAVMGGVTSASDWWGLGMLLLGILTENRCFAHAADQLFLINVQASGVTIPEELDARFQLLLRGLLTIDRTKRWQWKEVREWLAGGSPHVRDGGQQQSEKQDGPVILLANQQIRDARRFAIEASRATHWEDACELLCHGRLGLWAEELKLDGSIVAGLRQLGRMTVPDVGLRLALALQLLNPHLPLIYAETIVNPAWLLSHPELGYELITSSLPGLIQQYDIESNDWLLRLSRRVDSVRARAELQEIELNVSDFQVLVLSASHPLLARQWQQRRLELPDASHPSLASLMERDQQTDEDLILLLSAAVGQFIPAEEILAKANALAEPLELPELSEEWGREQLQRPRRELYVAVDDRIKGFARSGHSRLDAWADHFRMERRLPLPEVLLLLVSPAASWQKPENQDYIASILGFFEKKVSTSTGRGPLVRMTIGKTTPRVDMRELAPDRDSATALVTNLLQRTEKSYSLDSRILLDEDGPERRLRSLLSRTTQYLRDTGINGAHIGFPFALLRPTGTQTRPRLAPILLWPVKVAGEIGARTKFSLTFDRDRSGINLNPAFEGLFGIEETAQWKDIAEELLSRSSISLGEVIDAFGSKAIPAGRTLTRLPKLDASLQPKTDQIVCSAVLFHLEFTGQSLVEDLRQLKQRPVEATPLEQMLRVSEAQAAALARSLTQDHPDSTNGSHQQFLVTASDPSQEEAIASSSRLPGLVIQGPPGTGKSQTIVNLIANAIGHRKQVLVVCQKLPALEVVRKRLVAENLGERIVMLTNITSERRPLLQEIRSQLDGLEQRDSHTAQQQEQESQHLESQICRLEADIDRHHAAIYQQDLASTRSYRQILSELIQIEDKAATSIMDVVGLRKLFRNRSSIELLDCEEACGSVAEAWYAAHYEESPLEAVQPYAHDQASGRELQRLLELLAAAEQEREAIPHPLNPEQGDECPEGLSAWLEQHHESLLQWSDDLLSNAVPLFPQFRPQGHADEFKKLMERRLELLSSQGTLRKLSTGFSGWISPFDVEDVDRLAADCSRYVPLWLSAHFENSPLDVISLESPAVADVSEFCDQFRDLADAEEQRLASLRTDVNAIFVDSPEPLEQWLTAAEDSIRLAVQTAGDSLESLLHLEEYGGHCRRYGHIFQAWCAQSTTVPNDARTLPQLEQILQPFDEPALKTLIQQCSEVITHWIKEPLDSLLLNAISRFPHNQMECLAVEAAIQHYIDAEHARDALFQKTPEPVALSDTEALRQWLGSSEKILTQATESTFTDAGRWLPLFRTVAGRVSPAQELSQQLTDSIPQIEYFSRIVVDQRFAEKLSPLDDESLKELSTLIEQWHHTRPGFLGWRRMFAARPLQRWLQSHALPIDLKEAQTLDTALQQERSRRRVLQELNLLVQKMALSIDSSDWTGLIQQIQDICKRLTRAFQICKVTGKCPDDLPKLALARQEGQAAILKSVQDVQSSLQIQDAIRASEQALQRLSDFMSTAWMEWQSQNLNRGRLVAVHRGYLESLAAALPTLEDSAALRARLAHCHSSIPAILSALDPIRTLLESLSSESVAEELSHILRWHWLSARKHELEAMAPPIQMMVFKILPDQQDLENRLAAVCSLVPQIASCPIPTIFRQALPRSSSDNISEFFERCRLGIMQAQTRQRALHALSILEGRIDVIWMNACQSAILAQQSNQGRLYPVLERLPSLSAYLEFRQRHHDFEHQLREAFSFLSDSREALLELPPSDLSREVSQAIRLTHLQQKQTRLEQQEPVLRDLYAISIPDTVRVLELLQSTRELLRQIEGCPLAPPLRSAVYTGSRQRLARVLQDFKARLVRSQAKDRSLACLDELRDWMEPQWIANFRLIIVTNGLHLSELRSLIAAIPHLRPYQMFRARAALLSDLDFKVFRLLSNLRPELAAAVAGAEGFDLGWLIRTLIRREALLSWKMQIESRAPDLLTNRQAIAAKVANLEELDRKLRAHNRKRISTVPLDAIRPGNEWEDITRLSGPRARRLREFFSMGRERGLLALRPVWMMTPDVASQLLPLEASLFDLVIFDEASQMPVEYALPSLYRAKSVVVSGDEKQMPPSAFFTSRMESDETEWTDEEELDEYASEQERKIQEQTWNRREVKDCPDLLHMSLASLPQTTLQIHYRSAFRELIAYSNAAFYRNELGVPVRHPDDVVRQKRPIEYISAGGIYEGQQNLVEAQRVVDTLANTWQESKKHRPSIGIVTFNMKQADLIEDLLEKRAEEDVNFRQIYAAEQDRKDQGEDMSLFVKNVENVQGDERDYILFSTTFGRNRSGLFRRNFGVLGQAGGERRLNVAVTRARQKIIIVGSMPIEEISDMLRTRRRPETPRDYLQAYLHYATLVSQGLLPESRNLVERIAANPSHLAQSHDGTLDSFKQSVAQFVRELGHEPVYTADDPVLGVDFSLRDPKSGEFGLAIECDPPQHRLIRRARAREIWRPSLLARVYPFIHQVSVYAWYHAPHEERQRLRQQIVQAFPNRGVRT